MLRHVHDLQYFATKPKWLYHFCNLFESIYLKVKELCQLEVQVNCKLLFVFFQLLNLYKLLNKIMNLKQLDFYCEI